MENYKAKAIAALAACLFAYSSLVTHHSSLAAENAARDIREAFEKGGPLVSCWNVNGGWNLNQQVEWIKAGHHYHPTLYVPLTGQGANRKNRWKDWYAEYREALAYINQHKLPVTLRWHNWLNEMTSVKPEERGPFELSPLVHRRREDGSLDSIPVTDPFGPVPPWRVVGEGLGGSYWLARLAEVLPDVPRVYLLENNEGAIAELGNYTDQVNGNQPGAKDDWGYRRRTYKANLEAISVRAAEVAKTHSVEEFEIALDRGYRAKYESLTAGLLETIPPVWRGKATTGGYAGYGELAESGLLRQTFTHLRPQQDWEHSPWLQAIWRYTEPSDRCYDDGSGSPWNWHDWVRGPHILQHNFGPLTRFLVETRPLWHEDRSLWISPQRCRKAAEEHGGYVLPERAKGFARACLWADRPKGRATCLRWFAASSVKLADPWFAAEKDPPELRKLTQLDYFAPVMDVVDEVWEQPTLLRFWREGEPVVNPDPPLCNWVLPAAVGDHPIIDDRSRVLYTDADPPRFEGKKDTWRAADGKLELRVFAQAYRIGEGDKMETLVFAWSPRQPRENVTVRVPGIGAVLFDRVDQDGQWRVVPCNAAID